MPITKRCLTMGTSRSPTFCNFSASPNLCDISIHIMLLPSCLPRMKIDKKKMEKRKKKHIHLHHIYISTTFSSIILSLYFCGPLVSPMGPLPARCDTFFWGNFSFLCPKNLLSVQRSLYFRYQKNAKMIFWSYLVILLIPGVLSTTCPHSVNSKIQECVQPVADYAKVLNNQVRALF